VIAVIGEEDEKGAGAPSAPPAKPAETVAATTTPSNGSELMPRNPTGTPTAVTTPVEVETTAQPAAASSGSTEGATEIVMPQWASPLPRAPSPNG